MDPSLRFGVSEKGPVSKPQLGASSCSAGLGHDRPVAIGTAVAEELPGVADFRDHVQVQVCHHDFISMAAGLRDELAARIAEVALTVEFADIPWRFPAHAIDGADKISIGNGMRRLFQLP